MEKKEFKNDGYALLKVKLVNVGIESSEFSHETYGNGKKLSSCFLRDLIHAPEFTRGEMVEVCHPDGDYQTRIYLFSHDDSHYCVIGGDEDKYEQGHKLHNVIMAWDYIRKLPEKATMEVTVKIGDKIVPLKDVSEDTMMAIMKAAKEAE